MEKKTMYAIGGIAALLVIIVAGTLLFPKQVPILKKADACVDTGGQWTTMPRSCADDCHPEDFGTCPEQPTYGCDCGPNGCWSRNAGRCVAI